jgi:uroporphyrinogen-III synthase
MRLLITRPEPDARELKDALTAQGHDVSVEPLLCIELLPITPDALQNVQALFVTSRNGVRALAASAASAAARDLPIFCVGEGTAEAARESGFQRVSTGAGTASDLVPLVSAKADRATGALLHIAGENLAFDLAAALAAQGFNARTLTAYRALAAAALSTSTAQALREGRIDAVVLMSPRTAAIFAQLVADAGLSESAKKQRYICLSERVADALGDLAPGPCEIAASPNSQGMLAAIARVATQPTGV